MSSRFGLRTLVPRAKYDASSCGLRREAKSFFFLTEFKPFKFEYNSNFDHILEEKKYIVFQPIWQPYNTLRYNKNSTVVYITLLSLNLTKSHVML